MVPIALDRQSELVADLTQAEIEIFIALIDRLQAKVPDDALDEPAPGLPTAGAPSRQRPRRSASAPGRGIPKRRGALEARRD
jgi:hypothetical protein